MRVQVKLWAETHGLNEPKAGTLNSWSITQMVGVDSRDCFLHLLHEDCSMHTPGHLSDPAAGATSVQLPLLQTVRQLTKPQHELDQAIMV